MVTASGHCYAVDGVSGAVADGLVLDLSGSWMKLENGRFFQKANIAPETLLQLGSPEELMAREDYTRRPGRAGGGCRPGTCASTASTSPLTAIR